MSDVFHALARNNPLMKIEIHLQATAPPKGSVVTSRTEAGTGEATLDFRGWLELLDVLAGVVERDRPRKEQS